MLRSESQSLHSLLSLLLSAVRARMQGYSLLATVSGKSLPSQLKNYSGGGNAAETSSSLFKGGSMSNFYAKPSDAKRDNMNRPQVGSPPGLPGWGATSPKNAGAPPSAAAAASSPTPTPTTPASSPASAVLSPTDAAAASALAASSSSSSSSFGSAGRPAPLSVANGKCLVSSCTRRRFKNGYCVDCLQASAQRREAVFAGTEQE